MHVDDAAQSKKKRKQRSARKEGVVKRKRQGRRE